MIDLTPHGRPAAMGENVATRTSYRVVTGPASVDSAASPGRLGRAKLGEGPRCGGKLKGEEAENNP